MVTPARLTVLAPVLADLHETTGTPTCLIAPDGDTCCQQRAAYRIALEPMPGYRHGPVTFACDEHAAVLLDRPDVADSRRLNP